MQLPPGFVPNDQAPELTEEQAALLHCYTCGNNNAYELHEVDELVIVGENSAFVRIKAGVCLYCKARVFDGRAVDTLDKVRSRLEQGDFKNMVPVGTIYRVA